MTGELLFCADYNREAVDSLRYLAMAEDAAFIQDRLVQEILDE
jgi:hypothetical protein